MQREQTRVTNTRSSHVETNHRSFSSSLSAARAVSGTLRVLRMRSTISGSKERANLDSPGVRSDARPVHSFVDAAEMRLQIQLTLILHWQRLHKTSTQANASTRIECERSMQSKQRCAYLASNVFVEIRNCLFLAHRSLLIIHRFACISTLE